MPHRAAKTGALNTGHGAGHVGLCVKAGDLSVYPLLGNPFPSTLLISLSDLTPLFSRFFCPLPSHAILRIKCTAQAGFASLDEGLSML